MSFTLSFFDQRRSGMKHSFVIPFVQYIDGAATWNNPFRWDPDKQPCPTCLQEEPGHQLLAATLSTKRTASLKALTGCINSNADALPAQIAYHDTLIEAAEIAAASRPPEDIDP
ncbi:hypothetical protein DIPPA_12714, partial [Diplonema papillatum]